VLLQLIIMHQGIVCCTVELSCLPKIPFHNLVGKFRHNQMLKMPSKSFNKILFDGLVLPVLQYNIISLISSLFNFTRDCSLRRAFYQL